MSLVKDLGNGTAIFCCPECGKKFNAGFIRPGVDSIIPTETVMRIYEKLTCEKCYKRHAEQIKQTEQLKIRASRISRLDDVMLEAGFGKNFASLEKPPVRPGAVWIYKNKSHSLLISGETGTGKTSSSAFVIREMLKTDDLHVMYRSWQALMAEFISAKTASSGEAWFFKRIDTLDYLIVDEVIGKRGCGKLTPSGQDLLFSLIDGVYSGSRKTKVWFLGNFYAGSLDSLLDDPLPARRRLQESFKLAWFNGGDAPIDDTMSIFDKNERSIQE